MTTSAFIYSSAWLKRFSKPDFLSHCVVSWPPLFEVVLSFFHKQEFCKDLIFSYTFFCPLRCFLTTSIAIYYLLVEKTYNLICLCSACFRDHLWLWSALMVFFTLPGFMISSVLESLIEFAWKAEYSLAVGCIDSFFTLRCFMTTSAFIYGSAWLKRFSKPDFLAHCVVSWPPVFQVVLSFLIKREFWKYLIF